MSVRALLDALSFRFTAWEVSEYLDRFKSKDLKQNQISVTALP